MPDPRSLLEHESRRFIQADQAFERLVRRRDRKRRNQRITAGVVGIVVFAAAVLIVTTVGSFDRTQTPVVPGGTGPTETGPISRIHDVEDPFGLPPERVPPSTPEEGEVVAHFVEIHVGFVYVYADGRVIYFGDATGAHATGTIIERRLTPEALDLVLSGEVEPRRFLEQSDPSFVPGEVFEVAWTDPTFNPYVPSRYAICYADEGTNIVDPSGVVGLLPPRAEVLLRGKERTYHHTAGLGGDMAPATCFEVTTEEARALDDILRREGFDRGTRGRGTFSWLSPDRAGEPIWIVFAPLLPQGQWVEWYG